jgi:hypothetical protein
MAAVIINLESYRQRRDKDVPTKTSFDPAPDRLWEYLMRNIKIDQTTGSSSGSGTLR